MKAHRVSDRVFADTSGEGRGNMGVVQLQSYTLVIDSTMFPQTAADFRTSLERRIKSPIRKLILTHHHADHVFGNQIFEDCEIISSKPLKERMETLAPTEWAIDKLIEFEKTFPEFAGKLRNVKITFPTVTFEKTLTLKDGGLLIKIINSGGHSEDSSYIYFPEEKILFSGDLIFAKSFPWGGDTTCNPQKWTEVLREFLRMEIERIIPGHGPLCDKEEVKTYLEFFESTTSIMKELALQGLDEKEIAEYKSFPDFYLPRRPETRKMSFLIWYNFYKQKTEK